MGRSAYINVFYKDLGIWSVILIYKQIPSFKCWKGCQFMPSTTDADTIKRAAFHVRFRGRNKFFWGPPYGSWAALWETVCDFFMTFCAVTFYRDCFNDISLTLCSLLWLTYDWHTMLLFFNDVFMTLYIVMTFFYNIFFSVTLVFI